MLFYAVRMEQWIRYNQWLLNQTNSQQLLIDERRQKENILVPKFPSSSLIQPFKPDSWNPSYGTMLKEL